MPIALKNEWASIQKVCSSCMKNSTAISFSVVILLSALLFFIFGNRHVKTQNDQVPSTLSSTDTSKITDVVITLYRTHCFGTCPSYHVTIDGGGTVIYEGQSFVGVTGRQTGLISPEDVSRLVDEFNAIKYFSLADLYGEVNADYSGTITSIRLNGKTKEVKNYANGPYELQRLEDMIYQVADIDQWVAIPHE